MFGNLYRLFFSFSLMIYAFSSLESFVNASQVYHPLSGAEKRDENAQDCSPFVGAKRKLCE